MYGVAAKYMADQDADGHLKLARLYLALDERDAARASLDAASAAGRTNDAIRAVEAALR